MMLNNTNNFHHQFNVLLEIFKYIEDDKHSLYDCLLVNKGWFQLVVPLLWKRPFVLLKKSNNNYFDECLNITCNNNLDIENTENINRSSLIDTYIACSSDDFKSQLFDKFGICLSEQLKNPILNYSTYLKDLDLAELESSIICWLSLSDYCYNVYDVHRELLSFITSEICKMLFVNSNGLRSFSLGSWNEETSTIPNLSSLSSPLLVFRNLKTLEIKGDFDYLNEHDTANLTKILELLINNSTKNVEYINIDITGDYENSQTEKLRKLIESQRSLNYFRYSRTNCPEAFSEEYINSCSTQSKSLKKLVFDSVPLSDDSILPLIKCNNLDLLQFNSCYQKKNNTNNLMKINKLKFLNSHLDGVITTILYLVNCNLSELTLENSTKAHLEVINRHCANLNYLALSTTTNTLISSSILLSTTNLKHLVLNLKNYSTKMTEQDLNQLGKNLPISLNTLHLNSVFGYDELEYLLLEEGEIRRKSHNNNNNQNYYDNYLKVVMNYAKTKHLNEFSYNITKLKNQPSNLLSPEMIFSKELLNEAKQFIQNISTKSIFPFECDDYEVLCD
nr:6736_t:CDS:2 [Entrophospora candida]